MSAVRFAAPLTILRGVAWLGLVWMAGAGPALAGNADAIMEIVSNPDTASVSRDATSSTPAANFFVSYTVRITNPSNSSKNFRFVGSLPVSGGATQPPPTMFVSSRSDCTLTSATNPVQVTCPKLEVAKQATVSFSLQFRTPTDGDQLQLQGSLFFPVSSTSLTTSASATTKLVKLTQPEYTEGFVTYVPTSGGTFCTGDNGNGGQNNPGCVARSGDPITTTIVIANGSIAAPTTATVQEATAAVCTSTNFTACYESSLTIPGATFNPPLKIYLRIDKSKIITPTNVNNIKLYYENHPDPVPQCSGNLPQPGQPCWVERGIYPFNFQPADFQFDYYIVVLARNNGSYRAR